MSPNLMKAIEFINHPIRIIPEKVSMFGEVIFLIEDLHINFQRKPLNIKLIQYEIIDKKKNCRFTDLKFSETSNQSISRKRQNIKINNITPTKDPTSVGTEKNLGLNDLGDKGSFDIYKIQSIKFLSGRLDGIPVRLGNLYGVDSIFIRYTIKSFGANPGVSTILDIGGVHPRNFMQLIDS